MKPEEKVSSFYNSTGWEHDEEGNTLDANKWEDLRVVSNEYLVRCRKRLNRYIPKNGELFVDLGSGPIQYFVLILFSINSKNM